MGPDLVFTYYRITSLFLQNLSESLTLFSFQVNPELKHHFEKNGLQFVGQDVEGERMEVIELEGEMKVLFKNTHPQVAANEYMIYII